MNEIVLSAIYAKGKYGDDDINFACRIFLALLASHIEDGEKINRKALLKAIKILLPEL